MRTAPGSAPPSALAPARTPARAARRRRATTGRQPAASRASSVTRRAPARTTPPCARARRTSRQPQVGERRRFRKKGAVFVPLRGKDGLLPDQLVEALRVQGFADRANPRLARLMLLKQLIKLRLHQKHGTSRRSERRKGRRTRRKWRTGRRNGRVCAGEEEGRRTCSAMTSDVVAGALAIYWIQAWPAAPAAESRSELDGCARMEAAARSRSGNAPFSNSLGGVIEFSTSTFSCALRRARPRPEVRHGAASQSVVPEHTSFPPSRRLPPPPSLSAPAPCAPCIAVST